MRSKLLMMGVAALGLAAGPALAGGPLGMSGNMGSLLGGGGGHHAPPGGGYNGGGKGGGQHPGKGGGWGPGGSQSSSKSYEHTSQTDASKQSGSQYKNSSFNLRDTTIGGVYANPQVDATKLTKSFSSSSEHSGGGKGGHGGGHDHGKGGGHGGDKGGHGGYGGKGGHGGGSSQQTQADMTKKTFSASLPIGIESTTIGGFSSHKSSGKTWDNRSYSNKESTRYQASHAQQSGGGGHGPKH